MKASSRPLAVVSRASSGIGLELAKSTKLQGRASRVMRDGAQAAMHRRMAEPGSGKQQ